MRQLVHSATGTIITAAFLRRVAGKLHHDTAGSQMDLTSGNQNRNNKLQVRARFSFRKFEFRVQPSAADYRPQAEA